MTGSLTGGETARALAQASELAGWAAGVMRDQARRGGAGSAAAPRVKAHAADLVTDVDEQIERHVREELGRAFPDHAVIGEEFGERAGAPGAPTWVVDPVDGTTNFAHGIAWSSFSLGLRDAGGPLVAVVADPWRDELFAAARGHGATLDGRPIRACAAREVRGQVVMTEWAAHQPWPGMTGVLATLAERFCTVRIMGSTALSLVQVAAGRAAGALVGQFQAVDGEPALLIGVEAGALALDGRGRPTRGPDGGLLLAAPGVAAELAGIWQAAAAR